MLELEDIQSGVLRPRPAPYAATFILLRIDDPKAGRELMAQRAPRFQIWSKLQGDIGNVQQHRLTPFLHRQADQLRRVRAGRTQ